MHWLGLPRTAIWSLKGSLEAIKQEPVLATRCSDAHRNRQKREVQPIEGWTDGRKVRPSYRDAQTQTFVSQKVKYKFKTILFTSKK